MLHVKTQSVIEVKRRVIGLIAVLSVVVAGAVGVTAPVASAHGSEVPWHKPPVTECAYYNGSSRIVKAFTPGRLSVGGYSREFETIYWQADLYRYYPAYDEWYPVKSSPWLRASGNYHGLASNTNGSWHDYSTIGGSLYNYWSFSPLSTGSYAVEVTLFWASTGAQHSEWAPMTGQSFCTFNS